MIIIAATPYDPAPDLPGIEYKYGKDMVEALATMHNGGRPPVHKYATKAQLMIELNLRDKAIGEMGKANVSEEILRYATRRGDSPDGQLDPKYWDKVGFYQFLLTFAALPAPAVRSIFGSNDNVLECNSAMVAVEYGSMLETMGNDAFNKRVAGGSLIISPIHLPPRGVDEHPLYKEGMIESVTITGAKDLIPGDWVYFRNIADYLTKHPDGFWTGEHALYLGDGKFQGFGTTVLTENELREKLLDNYNVGLPVILQKQIGDVPGLQNYAHRPVVANILKESTQHAKYHLPDHRPPGMQGSHATSPESSDHVSRADRRDRHHPKLWARRQAPRDLRVAPAVSRSQREPRGRGVPHP